MGLSAATIWEVRTAGSDTNGGAYVSGGTDYSQQDSKNTVGNNISATDIVAVGTSTLTSATVNGSSALTGNVIYLQGGSGSLAAGWYQATFVSNIAGVTTFTVDRTVATGTGITCNIGGALASPGMALASAIGNNSIYIKTGTYLITSASTNISGGCLSLTTLYVEGYQANRGDLGTAPLLQVSGITTATLVAIGSNTDGVTKNISVDGTLASSIRGFAVNRGIAYRLTAQNCTNGAFVETANNPTLIQCYATGCTTAAAYSGHGGLLINCIAGSNSITGFSINSATCIGCIAYSNSGSTSDGFIFASQSASVVNCISYGNGRDGFRMSSSNSFAQNCIAEANSAIGAVGFNLTGSSATAINCAAFNNATNFTVSGSRAINVSSITGTATFFTSAVTNFSLNSSSGGGALARAAGYPGALIVGGTGYIDIGALQSQATAGGSAVAIFGG